ncbi:MAG: serine O-acetyltransferase [Ruminococcus sp.]|nr:serine O-acetyltransferase [Ruminococcus sp.]
MFEYIKRDIRLIRERDPAVHSTLEILLTYPSITAVRSYRIAHWFYKKKMFTIARMISQHSRRKTGIEIHPGAEIGKGLFIDHGMGVVIGETAVIGDNCLLYQGVTLGGTGKDKGKRHPTLGHNVLVGAGAKVLGPFKVGNNVKIAANAVVLNEIPDNCTAVGVPARVVRRNGKKICRDVCSEIDQIHIPDPVSLEMCRLRTELERLKQEVSYMKK